MIGEIDLVHEAIARCSVKRRALVVGAFPSAAAQEFLKAGLKLTVASTLDPVGGDPTQRPSDKGQQLRQIELVNLKDSTEACFDVVWCSALLERRANAVAVLEEIKRVLRPHGRLFLLVPHIDRAVTPGQIAPGWTVGLLAQFLCASGFDTLNAGLVRHGNCVFADVGVLHEGHAYATRGDCRLPDAARGDLRAWNWSWKTHPSEIRPARLPRVGGAGSRLTISFIVPWITRSRGGTENVGRMMANAMAVRGHRVQVLTFDDKRRPPSWPMHESVEIRHLPEDGAADMQMAVDVARFNPDVIVGLHLNSTFSKYVRISKRLDVPIVLSEHIDPRFPAMLGLFDPEERNVIFSGATRIHLLSDTFRQTLPDYLQDRIRVIANTCEEPKLKARPSDSRLDGIVLSVARLVPRKNMSALIHAFSIATSDFPGWMLQIVGDGPDRKKLENLASSLGIHGSVQFVGHTEEVEKYYRGANVFVLPSLFEGFPMSTLEAMSHGLPLIGYRTCNGVNHQIADGVNGLLSSGGSNLGSLAEDLKSLMSDSKLRGEMGTNSLLRFRELFSPEVIHSQWEELFLECAQSLNCNNRPSLERIHQVKLDELIWGRRV